MATKANYAFWLIEILKTLKVYNRAIDCRSVEVNKEEKKELNTMEKNYCRNYN
jgi:hypothetical protein